MKFDLFIAGFCHFRNTEKTWREGQCFFNALSEMKPDLANKIRGHDTLDPFYRNSVSRDTWDYVMDHWNDDMKESKHE